MKNKFEKFFGDFSEIVFFGGLTIVWLISLIILINLYSK